MGLADMFAVRRFDFALNGPGRAAGHGCGRGRVIDEHERLNFAGSAWQIKPSRLPWQPSDPDDLLFPNIKPVVFLLPHADNPLISTHCVSVESTKVAVE